MGENQQDTPQQSFFDGLMFGPSPSSSQRHEQEQKQNNSTTNETPNENPAPNLNQKNPEQQLTQQNQGQASNPMSQVDLNQLMAHIDTFVNYAYKIGPAINQLSPLLKMLQSFTDQNKK